MKYWIIDKDTYIASETKPQSKYAEAIIGIYGSYENIPQQYLSDYAKNDAREIVLKQWELFKKYNIKTNETINPETNQPWVGSEMENWIAKQLEVQRIKAEGENGQFALNITYIQGIMDFLFKLAEHESLFANNPNTNDRMVDNLDADYLIEASQLNRGAIDNFTFETKTMLEILFTRLEQNNSEHLTGKIDKLYLELIELLREFKDIDNNADLPKQLIEILEKIHKAFVPQTVTGHTLASEMPVDAGGTQPTN